MKTNEKAAKRVFNLIIVDESGSMYAIREQAFAGMNETLETIRKMQEQYPDREQRVTLITDGEENSSMEWTPDKVYTMIDKLKEQGWTFTLMGTDDIAVKTMAQSFAIPNFTKFKRSKAGARAVFSLDKCCR